MSSNYQIILNKFKNYYDTNICSLLNLVGYYIFFYNQFKDNMNTLEDYNQHYNKMKELIQLLFKDSLIYIDFSDIKDIFNIFNKIENLEFFLINLINENTRNIHLIKQELVKYMVNLYSDDSNININKNKKVLNLYSNYGGILHSLIINNFNNIHCYETNDELIQLSLINKYILNNKNDSIIIKKSNIIFDNLINESYDLILCDFPIGIRNIIHANCCEKIKELKIRGTKSEPLILQLIMTLLNKHGKAIINVPNTLLNNESTQHIETRKYLINNFNIKKIVTVDQDLQINKEYKTSIIYFEKISSTKKINFTKLEIKDTKLIETEICTIDYKKIESKKFNLYYEKYNENKLNESILNYEKMNTLVDVTYQINNNDNYLRIPLYLSNNKIELSSNPLLKDEFTLIVKNSTKCNQEYFNYYFQKIITPQINTYTKGKLLKIDIEELLNISILVPSIKNQKIIINYFNINNKLIEKNNEQIVLYENLKSEYLKIFLENIENLEYVELKTLCKIDTNTENINTIIIQRNSNQTGNVSLSQEKLSNTNMYFLNNVTINNKYLYYFLKENEDKLNKLGKITVTVNLSRTNLETFNIPVINETLQEKIVIQLDYYENIIKELLQINDIILSKNIIKEVINLKN